MFYRSHQAIVLRCIKENGPGTQDHHQIRCQLDRGWVGAGDASEAAGMSEQQMERFEIVVEEGPPHGDLYELEQTTYYRVVDTHSREAVMTFQGEMEASLSKDDGMWTDHRFSGVQEVNLAPDGQSVVVTYCDGHEETVPLPG